MTAAENPEDDDALFVLTAAMLTPGQFPGVLGDDYPAACAELGLEPLADGYGLVFGQDGGGARWTVATTDTAMVACALAAWDCGLEYDLAPDENSLAASLPGWPLPVAVAVPGIPAPHDPTDEEGGRAPLSPPDTSVWGPPQRRLGADEIAVRWFEWRDQLDVPAEAAEEAAKVTAKDAWPDASTDTDTNTDTGTDTGTDAGTAVGTETESEPQDAAGPPAAPPSISHTGIRRVLESAEEYVRNPPPPGRVRAAYGAVRADGPGWSLVGRTDDIAFVLLDDAPGEVLPVGRGAALPPLLEALSKLAAAPS
ncbi:hypothetical protein [Streptomyces sp. CBMA29]|uniref:hypothetical protein n=1 Tax=Streptomyces sp. CBMA29 TaxID=1896314 RepID=UPI001661A49B|nr:hypothetical protein [Streptomyces sp. CBMA29]MBD0738922.1 hypothetical protein [Streptomyces sp. CBMA29]